MLAGLFILLLVLIFTGFPVLLAIGLTGLAGILATGTLPPAIFAQRIFAILDSFSLLALPYFILAGAIMSRGGLARSLIEFSEALVGHVRGNLGHTTVVSSMAMANISGSSSAEAAAIGSVVIPEMKKRGYRSGLAASIVATAATIGPIIPPSMTMIVYGSMTGVSIGGLFLAGVVPGILMGVALMATILLMAYSGRYPELSAVKPFAGVATVARATLRVWPVLLVPVIILGGIFGGIFTATEAGVVVCLYSLMISLFHYRSIKLSDIPSIMLDAAVTTAIVVGIISMAGALGWLLSFLRFNDNVLSLVRSIASDGTMALLLLLGAIFVMALFIESLAVLIILIPVAAFIGRAYGLDPLHLGVLMVMATQIGATTPPVAVLMFITTGIAGGRFTDTIRHCAPFILALVAVLVLVLFFPQLATTLPRMAQ